MNILRVGIVLLAMMFVSGCATNIGSSQIEDFGKYTSLEKGVTTKEDVFSLFGQPHDVRYFESGENVWVYYHVKMTMSGATFIPIVGLFAGGNNSDVRIANFYFSDDVYSKLETLSKSQYVNQWVGMATIAVKNDEMDNVDKEMAKLNLPFDQGIARRMKGVSELFDN
jgi:outer membrane protein assembly factor BamE (lipoprotein component of BamABCDE complex)